MEQQAFWPSTLVPVGFVVESTVVADHATIITVRAVNKSSACPRCGRLSARVHSRYRRQLLDLPIGGRPVRLVLEARRFYCDVELCGQRIFTERFDKDLLAPWSRRTSRLEKSAIRKTSVRLFFSAVGGLGIQTESVSFWIAPRVQAGLQTSPVQQAGPYHLVSHSIARSSFPLDAAYLLLQ